jgi:hypothetical protein
MGVARRIRYQECPFKYVWRRDGTEILYQRTSSDIQMHLFIFAKITLLFLVDQKESATVIVT